jgi:hypothetical protein
MIPFAAVPKIPIAIERTADVPTVRRGLKSGAYDHL